MIGTAPYIMTLIIITGLVVKTLFLHLPLSIIIPQLTRSLWLLYPLLSKTFPQVEYNLKIFRFVDNYKWNYTLNSPVI